jgi:adenylate kinase family enzyme
VPPSTGSCGTLGRMSHLTPPIGPRVVVTGLAGSGKSTFALALADKTSLRVIHLDLEFWKPGWVAPSEAEWRSKQGVVLAGDAWIADGNYTETLDLRVERADTVVVLDMPWWLCAGRALLRGFQMPGELPEGCYYSRQLRLRDEWLLAVRIWGSRRSDPQREREVLSQLGPSVTLHVLKSRRAVREFLGSLDADHLEADER